MRPINGWTYKKRVTNEQLGRRIRDLRKGRDLNQAALASELGVSQAAVSGWENGAWPSLEQLQAIAAFFDMAVAELLADDAAVSDGGADENEEPRNAASG